MEKDSWSTLRKCLVWPQRHIAQSWRFRKLHKLRLVFLPNFSPVRHTHRLHLLSHLCHHLGLTKPAYANRSCLSQTLLILYRFGASPTDSIAHHQEWILWSCIQHSIPTQKRALVVLDRHRSLCRPRPSFIYNPPSFIYNPWCSLDHSRFISTSTRHNSFRKLSSLSMSWLSPALVAYEWLTITNAHRKTQELKNLDGLLAAFLSIAAALSAHSRAFSTSLRSAMARSVRAIFIFKFVCSANKPSIFLRSPFLYGNLSSFLGESLHLACLWPFCCRLCLVVTGDLATRNHPVVAVVVFPSPVFIVQSLVCRVKLQESVSLVINNAIRIAYPLEVAHCAVLSSMLVWVH